MLAALQQLKKLKPLATGKSSAELRVLMQGIERKSIFSARTNLAGYVADIKAATTKYLAGDTNLATGKLELLQALQKYGYTPERGFPGAPDAGIPAAEAGSLTDLSSDRRLELVLQTNLRQAANFAKKQAGNEPDALEQYPAWELVRVYSREVPRGFRAGAKGALVEVPDADWPSRFRKAAELAGDDDALRVLDETGRLIARKDSPVWTELGNPDNFDDAIGTDYPPFAFGSGQGWRAVPRAECIEVGLIDAGARIAPQDSEFAAELLADADTATLADLKATRNALLAAAQRLRGAA